VRGVGPEPIEITVEPPESAMLDYDPSPAEVLGTLTAAFGLVQVERWPEGHEPSPPAYPIGRGRVIDLEHASLEDLRRAVDQLIDQDWCKIDGDRCDPEHGYSCRRHSWRKRVPRKRKRAA
jgi:hypothetical protein